MPAENDQLKLMQQEHEDLIRGAINQRDAYANEGIKLNAMVMKLQREASEKDKALGEKDKRITDLEARVKMLEDATKDIRKSNGIDRSADEAVTTPVN